MRLADGRHPTAHARIRYSQHSWRHRRIRSGCHGNTRHKLGKTRHDKWVQWELTTDSHLTKAKVKAMSETVRFLVILMVHLHWKISLSRSVSVGVYEPLPLYFLTLWNHLQYVSRIRNRWIDRRDENEWGVLHIMVFMSTWRCWISIVTWLVISLVGYKLRYGDILKKSFQVVYFFVKSFP